MLEDLPELHLALLIWPHNTAFLWTEYLQACPVFTCHSVIRSEFSQTPWRWHTSVIRDELEAPLLQERHNLSCLGHNFSFQALPAVYILRVNWQANLFSHQLLDLREWSLHPEVFQDLCHKWGHWMWISWPSGLTTCTGLYPGVSSACSDGFMELVHTYLCPCFPETSP